MSESKFTVILLPPMEINMDRAVESRKAINEVAPVKISYNDIVIKASGSGAETTSKGKCSLDG
ncbi:MAG: hypothetical protein R3B93_20675 [Bacteroidia bacterium]